LGFLESFEREVRNFERLREIMDERVSTRFVSGTYRQLNVDGSRGS